MQKMNERAKSLAMEHYNIIKSFVRARGIDYDEWHGTLSCALCSAAMNYDETSEAAFKTFAYRCLQNAYLNGLRKPQGVEVVSFSEYETEESSGEEVLSGLRPDLFAVSEEETYNDVIINDMDAYLDNLVKNELGNEDAEVFLRFAAGEGIRKIAAEYGLSKSACSRRVMAAKKKLAANPAILELRGVKA